ncbi:MAG TPA: UTP--glucose-1-phosphate uridylyltransferase, partial [Chloroflexi bacterium]|nr:UTP--glucose-1-phosphate uridylyltransferase [Chloroflexota bacterium]
MIKDNRFVPFAEKMRRAGLPEIFIRTFAWYYEQLLIGDTGLIPEDSVQPVDVLPDAEDFPESMADIGRSVLGKTAVIKLNGGLGTSMGLQKAKSLLEVKNGQSFLDIIARQTVQAGVPLVLMDSFSTHEDSMAALSRHPELNQSNLLAFLQHKEPKVNQADLTPAEWPPNPDLEWCPPGHGDIYPALISSGTLDALLAQGYEYAFVSNSDNLGGVIDLSILGYFAQNNIPFMMEAADRTEMDRKGGHLARRADGQLLLRESAQTPDADMDSFQNIARHKYFNTNNLWFHLPTLQRVMAERDNLLGLPMIRNSKTVDPRDPASTPVYQLETAMGSAIAVFEGAQAVRVPRSRFAPVKTSNELLAVRSDAFTLTEDYHIVLANGRTAPPVVLLDMRYYKFISDLESRFPYGAPSLVDCLRLEVKGDFRFGRDVVCQDEVLLINESDGQVVIPDGA